jgi:hypothetical protein
MKQNKNKNIHLLAFISKKMNESFLLKETVRVHLNLIFERLYRSQKMRKCMINEIFSWFVIKEEHRHNNFITYFLIYCLFRFERNVKFVDENELKRIRTYAINAIKNKKKYNKLLHTSENEKYILENKMIELINKNTKLEIDNQELKEKLKNKNFKSQNIFSLIPIYASIYE